MKRILLICYLLCALSAQLTAQVKIFPIENGKLVNDLDADGKQIVNLDTSNLILGAGIYQPLNGTLTTISGLTAAPYGMGILQLPDSATARVYLGISLPVNAPKITNRFISSYNSATGDFTQDVVDLSGASGVLPLSKGGTNATTAAEAIANLLPSQAGQAGKSLSTNGTTPTWITASQGAGTSNAIATLTSKPISNSADPTNGQVLGYDSSSSSWKPISVSSAASGTVTSVAIGGLDPLFTTSVATPTGAASATFTFTSTNAHTVFGNNTPNIGTPAYFELNISSLADAGSLAEWSGKSAPTGNVVGDVDPQELANKTIDANFNIIKTVKYIRFDRPNRVDGSGAVMLSAPNADYNNQCKFSNFAPAGSNYAEYRTTVPDDFDISVPPRVRLKFRNWSNNPLGMRYIFYTMDVANDAPSNQNPQNAIIADTVPSSSSSDADIESLGWITMTGWESVLIPGDYFIIRVARDGNAAQDPSSADTVTMTLELEYHSIQ